MTNDFPHLEKLADNVNNSTYTTINLDFSVESHPGDSSPGQTMAEDSPSYAFAANNSYFSANVDRWMRGTNNPPNLQSTGVQGSRSLNNNSFTWSQLGYLLAAVLPLANLNSAAGWRVTPSLVIQTIEVLGTKLLRGVFNFHANLRRFAEDQLARDLFATAMDVVLVVYAMGFLVLSLYQAAVFGAV